MSSLRIRAAQASDVALLAQWAQAMALETESRTLDAATVHAGMAAGIEDAARARYFIAMHEASVAGRETIAEPVGTLMLTREWSDWRNGEWWWIQSVYVAPEHRRAGVYRALHAHVAKLARETPGVIGLRLYVETHNAVAQATYAALGMKDAGYRIFEKAFEPGP